MQKWINTFQKAGEVMEYIEDKRKRQVIQDALHSAMFLVAFMESQMAIECDDEVTDRALNLQIELYA